MNNLSPGEPLQIGRYQLLGRLGRGGMGTVYLGQDDTGQRVAVKVINPEYSQHEQFRVRFRREAESARRVRRFCTAAVLDADLDGDQLYVVTEYVDGPNLHEAVQSSGPLRGSSLDALAVGVATALTAIHSAGIVHRDLKPSNVLLSPVGPRVIDFGIARALDTLSGITGTGELMGTPRYMAPEVLRGDPASPACDVFSWGCLVAFAASGRSPFGGESLPSIVYQVLNTEPALEGVEGPLRGLVVATLNKDPARRPTAQQILDQMVGRTTPERAEHSVVQAWQQTPAYPGAAGTDAGQAPASTRPAGPGQGQGFPGAAATLQGQPPTLQGQPTVQGLPPTVQGAPPTVQGSAPTAHGQPPTMQGPAPGFQQGQPPYGQATNPGQETLPGQGSVHEQATLHGRAPFHARPPVHGQGSFHGQPPGQGPVHGQGSFHGQPPGQGPVHGQGSFHGQPPGQGPGVPGRAWDSADRRKRLIGIGVAAVIVLVAGGFSLRALLASPGPPTDLSFLYRDDFNESGTGWGGGEYTGQEYGLYGYAPGGYYAVDVDDQHAERIEKAPIPFVPRQPPTPAPSTSPTPTTPERLLLTVTATVKDFKGPGELGVFCRADEEYRQSRYEFLLTDQGEARIRRVTKGTGGNLTTPVPVSDVKKGHAVKVQAECSPTDHGMQLTMWVNGDLVQSYVDNSGSPSSLPNGDVGFLARVPEKSGASMKTCFDDFTVQGPSSAASKTG
ncbi:serine/threonine protein kinase [Sphaerisporangium perillae]|uniref:serine/threonine protein kinase n=1 Tax=Sphaerisporangium perillae TaxID=2935860 RepID=UPI00200BB364|nr:serine/threonine-protein kinase [Sphaerisporangium perillae]